MAKCSTKYETKGKIVGTSSDSEEQVCALELADKRSHDVLFTTDPASLIPIIIFICITSGTDKQSSKNTGTVKTHMEKGIQIAHS